MNTLFPLKFMAIMSQLDSSEAWLTRFGGGRVIKIADNSGTKFKRASLFSPQVHKALHEFVTTHPRVRLAIPVTEDDRSPLVYGVRIEVYGVDGNHIKTLEHKEWSFALSMAIETELMGIICDIDQS